MVCAGAEKLLIAPPICQQRRNHQEEGRTIFEGTLYLFQYDEGNCTTKGEDCLDDFSSARHISDTLSGRVHPSHLEEGPHPAG
jgi:hypothetical protein